MRVVIAEDLALLRDGLTRLLRDHGMDVVAAVEDGDALVRAVEEHRPDVAVTDVRLPPGFTDEGLRAAVALRASRPSCPSWYSASTSSRPTPPSCSTPIQGAAAAAGSATCSRTGSATWRNSSTRCAGSPPAAR
jgi:DNA-binding NarL/FixJ family response regulator